MLVAAQTEEEQETEVLSWKEESKGCLMSVCLQDEMAFKQKQKEDQKAMEALRAKATKGPLGETRNTAMLYMMYVALKGNVSDSLWSPS